MYYLYYHLAGQKSSNCCLAHNTSEKKTERSERKRVRERTRKGKTDFFFWYNFYTHIMYLYQKS